MAEVSKIATIHGEDIVELVEVLCAYTPGSPAQWDPVPHRDLRGARVGGLSHVPRPRSCRIHADPVRKIGLGQTVCQDAFSQRRTADVAQAYEKNRDVVFGGHLSDSEERSDPWRFGIPGRTPKLIGQSKAGRTLRHFDA